MLQVGGSTWAGGTGGSNTAGLGGRGGPYRLDKGHAVHQVSGVMMMMLAMMMMMMMMTSVRDD